MPFRKYQRDTSEFKIDKEIEKRFG